MGSRRIFVIKRSDGAGIEAAAQEDAERDIAHQMAVDGAFQQVAITVDVVAFIVRFIVCERLRSQ